MGMIDVLINQFIEGVCTNRWGLTCQALKSIIISILYVSINPDLYHILIQKYMVYYLHGPWGIAGTPHDGSRVRGSKRGIGGHMDPMQCAEAQESGVPEVRMGLDLRQSTINAHLFAWYVLPPLGPPLPPHTMT